MKSLQIGDVVDHYRIQAVVGWGGMGVVYKAWDERLQRPVAVKVVAPELSSDPWMRARFVQEARLAARLRHPNVVRILEADECDGISFIVMEWIEGSDLDAIIVREKRLRPSEAARIVAKVGEALDAAHGQGLVHRDVKPRNVLVARDGGHDHVYLTDFGIALAMGAPRMTSVGSFPGTADYVSPEQVSGMEVDARSDVYSLGCVLYESLTGEVPFPRTTDQARWLAHMNDEPPRPSAKVSGLPVALDEVVVRAMAKDPKARFPSAGDLGRAAVAAAKDSLQRTPDLVAQGEVTRFEQAAGAAASLEAGQETTLEQPAAPSGPAPAAKPSGPAPAAAPSGRAEPAEPTPPGNITPPAARQAVHDVSPSMMRGAWARQMRQLDGGRGALAHQLYSCSADAALAKLSEVVVRVPGMQLQPGQKPQPGVTLFASTSGGSAVKIAVQQVGDLQCRMWVESRFVGAGQPPSAANPAETLRQIFDGLWDGLHVPAAANQVAPRDMPPAGWHPDPYRQARLRYWDGSQWTGYVSS